MKIPASFVLGGVTWRVEKLPLTDALGLCLYDKAVIRLDDSLPPDVMEQTFAHELNHALMYSMGMRDHDERFVDGLATMLHQYFKQFHK
jgi:hypothetical protein